MRPFRGGLKKWPKWPNADPNQGRTEWRDDCFLGKADMERRAARCELTLVRYKLVVRDELRLMPRKWP